MNRHLCVLGLLLVQVGFLLGDDQVGRYQLVSGTYGSSSETRRNGVIKIDSVTGETWELVVTYFPVTGSNNSKGRVDVIGWSKISPDLAEEVTKLRASGLIPK